MVSYGNSVYYTDNSHVTLRTVVCVSVSSRASRALSAVCCLSREEQICGGADLNLLRNLRVALCYK